MRGQAMTDSNEELKAAKVEASIAKAKMKALRPWFKKKRFIVPIAFLLLIGISQVAGGGKDKSETSQSGSSDQTNNSNNNSTEDEKLSTSMPGIGDNAIDGELQFTVTDVKCGIEKVGSEYLNAEPQGQFCKIGLVIENVGNESATMYSSSQDLYDNKGRKFATDETAMIYSESENDTWLNEINPGNSVDGSLIYDVPKDVVLDYIELHGDLFSDGVKVALQ
jgi:hypothetical protein